MKKRFISFIVVALLLVSAPVTASAATPRTLSVIPRITYSGTTATCAVNVTGCSLTDEIEVVVKLWNGNTCLETWESSGVGFLFFKEYYNDAEKNITYTLTTDLTINGVTEPRISISEKND